MVGATWALFLSEIVICNPLRISTVLIVPMVVSVAQIAIGVANLLGMMICFSKNQILTF